MTGHHVHVVAVAGTLVHNNNFWLSLLSSRSLTVVFLDLKIGFAAHNLLKVDSLSLPNDFLYFKACVLRIERFPKKCYNI